MALQLGVCSNRTRSNSYRSRCIGKNSAWTELKGIHGKALIKRRREVATTSYSVRLEYNNLTFTRQI